MIGDLRSAICDWRLLIADWRLVICDCRLSGEEGATALLQAAIENRQ
jgi:hypothetical protein